MGIDTDVLLRIRDRKALREALEARAARERKRWADDGREAEYEALLRDGYDPMPLIRPLDDGSAMIFTGLRFHDEDMEFSIRCWLAEPASPTPTMRAHAATPIGALPNTLFITGE